MSIRVRPNSCESRGPLVSRTVPTAPQAREPQTITPPPRGRTRRSLGWSSKATPAFRVEDAREDRRGVEVRYAEPVDGAVECNECARAPVADDGVVANGA